MSDQDASSYRRLEGSERSASKDSIALGPAKPDDVVDFSVVVRRRPDGPPLPDFSHFQSSIATRPKYTPEQFAEFFGATQSDLEAVAQFLRDAGMTVVETNAARRTVIAKGTVQQVNVAFTVALKEYDSPAPTPPAEQLPRGAHRPPPRQRHRSYEGSLHVPNSVAAAIVGVYGLDNRKVTSRSASPPGATMVTVPQVCQIYGWPTGSVPSQTVGILSEGGLDPNDVTLYYKNLNQSILAAGWYVQGSPPSPPAQPVPAGAVTGSFVAPEVVFASGAGLGANSGVSDGELNMDVSISSTVAQGATIAVYLFDGTVNGWITAINAAVHPAAGQPVPTVVSCSYYLLPGDDADFAADQNMTAAQLDALISPISSALQDASLMDVTICFAAGDRGTDGGVNDGYAHVQYPPSDPWILCCGGTGLGNFDATAGTFDEWIWNDATGATGGGVSGYFPLPSYQSSAGVPQTLDASGGVALTRGIPDVAANSSPFSGYAIYVNGVGGAYGSFGGTSAAAPLIAGLIAQANAWHGRNIGFVNPLLYGADGSACRRVPGGMPLEPSHAGPPSPADNAYAGVTGYSAGAPGNLGWNPCTGWGVFDWPALQALIGKAKETKETKETKELKELKDVKEKESSIEKVRIIENLPSQAGAAGSFGAQLSWLQSFAAANMAQGTQLAERFEQLGREVRELRAFIRPRERPPVGEQAITEPQQHDPQAGAAADEPA